ncbi:MAG: hypothetical protein ACI9SJ_000890 [Flavobacteriaceae bacterium]|jgi:hypothetical protein|uniref:DUF4350 domain-containing protein n=1 Tax=Candidatus Marifrigoribacter sp. Uisw_064 TaxID=3230970 RepID=UPI003AE26BAC
MGRFQKTLLVGFLIVIAGFIYLEATKPMPINWYPSYNNEDKIPYGTHVLFKVLEDTFLENITEITQSPFEKLQDSLQEGNYIFINDQIGFDEAEQDKMLNWISKGNSVFIASNYISKNLLDTLKLKKNTAVLLNKIGTEPLLNLVNKDLKSKTPYHIKRDLRLSYFEEIDTLSHTVLGVTQVYNDTLKITKPLVNFIKAPVGNGFIYIHTQPEIFTNYFLLIDDNATYTQQVLSYINNGKLLLWDRHYKSGKRINLSPLHILFSNKYLKWAYYFVLIGAFLFVIFEGKRKQRSIPIVAPLTNKTYEYTRTISGMYLDKKENHKIAQKQIALFFEFIRTRLRVPTEHINSRFFNAVASRTGNDMETTKNLFTFIEKVQHQQDTSQSELIKLYEEITVFKKNTDGRT